MTIVSKAAGALSISSCLYDMHKCGVIGSNRSLAKTSANGVISNTIGCSKANRVSYKDATIKNFLMRNNIGLGVKEFGSRITGYLKGFLGAGVRYIPNFALGAVALLAKSKGTSKTADKIANLAAVGLGIVEGYDIIVNSTNFGQRTDYLNYK